MADGFIVRKGGVTTAQALAPTITEVSTTDTSITFTITNNDASTAVILYEVDDATPDANSIELAAAATSSNLTVTGLTGGTEYDVYATANVTGKIKSNVAELAIETDPPIIYTAATGGTTLEYDSGGKRFKSHTFTSSGNFVVSNVGDNVDDRNKVDYLIIAGGGGTGTSGAGAGGYRTTNGTSGANSSAESKVTVTLTTFGVVVGLGGTSGNPGTNGFNSSAFNFTSLGGGRGTRASGDVAPSTNPGVNGGSGGGAGHGFPNTFANGGLGTANQGRNGGNAVHQGSAGGGGALQVGGNGTNATNSTFGGQGGNGGNGLANLLRTGSNETRAGGGGGFGFNVGTGSGGLGGGGNFNSNGAVNTGGGAGGGSNNGGSGIVVIRYEIAPSV